MTHKKKWIFGINPFVLIFLVLIILFFGEHIPFVKYMWVEETETCEIIFKNLTLQSVSGIEDINTGLLSGGSVYRKDLLFSNGRIEQFRTNELPELILGRQYKYEVCEYQGGFVGIDSGTRKTLDLIEDLRYDGNKLKPSKWIKLDYLKSEFRIFSGNPNQEREVYSNLIVEFNLITTDTEKICVEYDDYYIATDIERIDVQGSYLGTYGEGCLGDIYKLDWKDFYLTIYIDERIDYGNETIIIKRI